MTSAYRRDHITSLKNDEFERLALSARTAIIAQATAFEALYPLPVASNGEKLALRRAMARFLIDSGKASLSGVA